ncbi:hypothetical protein C8T65DRAFT_262362 [Cerioporus squamosus]|nr:hypothetical protein C8T65DRAFT_262362 [Cerioporus squamosus]
MGPGDPVHDAGQTVYLSPPEHHSLLGESKGSFGRCVVVQSSSGRFFAVISDSAVRTCTIWRMVDLAPTYESHQLTYGNASDYSCRYPYRATFVGDDILIVGFNDGTICSWDLSSFPLATTSPLSSYQLPGPGVASWTMSPTLTLNLACTHGCAGRPPTTPAIVVPRRTDKIGDQVRVDAAQALGGVWVNAARVSQYVATTSKNTPICLWSAVDGSLIWTSGDCDTEETMVVFTPDERILASGDKHGRVCLRALSRLVKNVPLPAAQLTVDGALVESLDTVVY